MNMEVNVGAAVVSGEVSSSVETTNRRSESAPAFLSVVVPHRGLKNSFE